MKKKYNGIIISESITDNKLIEEISKKAIQKYAHKLNNEIDTTIYNIELDDDEVLDFSKRISKGILPNGFYVHFVCEDEMIVIYPNKIFSINRNNLSEIENCILYGENLGINRKMLKFDEMFEKDHPNDKNAIVFGGSGDLGNEFVELLYNNGYSVYSTFNNSKSNNIKSKQLFFDAESDNEEFFKKISNIDIKVLVFCIGVRSSKKIVINTDYDEFNRLININAISFLRIYKKLYQNLRKNNANVLVVSSSASLDNKKTNGAYSTSKACLDSISETLKKEETEYGVTINVIHPSLFDSKLAHEIVKIKGYDDFDKYVAEVLNGEIKSAKEVAVDCKKYIL